MNQKSKLILLGALMVVLVIVAAVVLTRPKAGKTAKRAKAASSSSAGAAAKVPAAPKGDAKPVDAALPLPADMDALDEWLGADSVAISETPDRAQVLGLAMAAKPSESNRIIPGAIPFETPPQLEGIFWREGKGMALIKGEAYGVGELVAGTSFRVTGMSRSEVVLKSEDGREVNIDLYSSKEQ